MQLLRNFHPPRLRQLTVLACAGALLALTGCGAKPGAGKAAAPKASSAAANKVSETAAPQPEQPAEMLVAKSAFDASLEAGRDPFFPTSTRRVVVSRAASKAGVSQPAADSSGLKLAGIWLSKGRPVALINQTAFQPGETWEVAVEMPGAGGRRAVQKLRVRCLEIRPASVLINVAGEPGTKELRMANGL